MQNLLSRLGVEIPIIQAPMAGAQGVELAIAVAEAGGLGSLPCAMISPEEIGRQVALFRERTKAPLNLNFFAHRASAPDAARDARWMARLAPYYAELGLEPVPSGVGRRPFDDEMCALVEGLRPEIVSFHFGLPEDALLERVRAADAQVWSSATTIEEARWLDAAGVDAIIAQGAEAGGHRGMFLTEDVSTQIGLFSLLPQIVDAVKVPVIAAGGVADARGVAAAFGLGASAMQIGTAYLFCPEAKISPVHRAALRQGGETAITNLMTGRPARGLMNRIMRELGPMNAEAPAFPNIAPMIAPLRAKAESLGRGDFTSLWAGQSFALGREMGAAELTRTLWADALEMTRR
ncbi:MAG: nitronate monooxygenase [Hyphomonadaceae bacterium]|nr:nitronate monooxygenase [Hyphomonadaceae bacterium]